MTERNTDSQKQHSGFKYFLNSLFQKNESMRDRLQEFFEETGNTVSNDQMQMILAVIRLVGLNADQIKVPVPNMVTLSHDATIKDITHTFKKSGHSRLPVYRETSGRREYLGILYAKDILQYLNDKSRRFHMKKYMRRHQIVPETQSLLSLLRDMRLNRNHLALTVNEYGDVTGLVTLEDILEEIVGEIQDEYDNEKKPIKEIGLRKYRVDGATSLNELNNSLTVNFPEEKFNTLSGFLLHELKGEVSKDASVKHGSVILTVENFSGSQIKTVLIDIPPVE